MISEKMQEFLNQQIQKEFYSAYLYLSMEAYLEEQNLKGFAQFFRVQIQEERDHAMMFFKYISHVQGNVKLLQIDQPKTVFTSPLDVFKAAYNHELIVTKSIYSIVDLSLEEKDHKTNAFLQWFVNEQAEEEANMDDNIKKLQLIGGDSRGILMMDAELMTRIYTPSINPALGAV
ncbi:MAG: ferritin [Clostridiaceae bacterium]